MLCQLGKGMRFASYSIRKVTSPVLYWRLSGVEKTMARSSSSSIAVSHNFFPLRAGINFELWTSKRFFFLNSKWAEQKRQEIWGLLIRQFFLSSPFAFPTEKEFFYGLDAQSTYLPLIIEQFLFSVSRLYICWPPFFKDKSYGKRSRFLQIKRRGQKNLDGLRNVETIDSAAFETEEKIAMWHQSNYCSQLYLGSKRLSCVLCFYGKLHTTSFKDQDCWYFDLLNVRTCVGKKHQGKKEPKEDYLQPLPQR